ncbi:DUF6090 family protein, partial [Lutimonas sp.]|uniref:DUF6090 family protein n=1 Tax=Lutimonas sp. TaxID=1872403 RepID=UPI003C743B6F
MADDNKPLKYMRYAIGEIVLVVVGILIALQINNWNEERQLKESVKVYLNRLVEDLNNDVKFLYYEKSSQQFRYHCMQQLLKYAGLPANQMATATPDPYTGQIPEWEKPIPQDIDPQFLKIAIDHTSRLPKAVLVTSTINELKNSGLFSYINDEKVIDAINDYYSIFENNLGESENENILLFRNNWTNILAENGYNSYGLADYVVIIEWLSKDPRGEAALRNLISNAEWRYWSSQMQIEK